LKAPVKFDEYYLIERVAVGGMAEVFKGVSYTAEGFERLTAVKRVLPHIAEDKDFIEMFIDEAEIAAQLQHPNIGQVFHLGQSEGKYFIAMEFISGQDLRALYDHARDQQQHLDINWCVYMAREVCEALDYAHRKRDAQQRPLHLIHRDVSPQNILMSYDGSVKLIDFGIAKANNKINQTQVGILKGKFSYMSPEQARGLKLDARSDLFALAVVLYELVTLERCFYGQSDFSTIERVRNLEYVPPRKIRREIPSALEKIIAKGLARDPDERYQSAADFQEALSRYLKKYAPQFSRAQAKLNMQACFGLELQREQGRLDEYRAYAAEHIPEASRAAAAGGRGRFDPRLSAPRDESRPRYAQEGPRLSINPSSDRPRELGRRPTQGMLSDSGTSSSRARLLLLVALGMLAGGGAAIFANSKAPRVGQLHISSKTHTPGRFLIEGMGARLEGLSPALISDLAVGEYKVKVSAEGYPDRSFAVRIEPNKRAPLITEGSPLPGIGFHKLSSVPSGAEVRLDGVAIGETPMVIAAPLGPHQLELSLSGYETLRQTVTMTKSPQALNSALLFPEQVQVQVIPSVSGAELSLRVDRSSAEWRSQGFGEQRLVLRNTGRVSARVSASGFESVELLFPRYLEPEVTEWVELRPLTNTGAQPAESQRGPNARRRELERAQSRVSQRRQEQEQVAQREAARAAEREAAREAEREAAREAEREAAQRARRKASRRRAQQRRSQQRRSQQARSRQVASAPEQRAEERQPGFLKLQAYPIAEVFYKGKSIGWTPILNFKLPEGRHYFTLKLATGETYKIHHDIQPGLSSKRIWRKP